MGRVAKLLLVSHETWVFEEFADETQSREGNHLDVNLEG